MAWMMRKRILFQNFLIAALILFVVISIIKKSGRDLEPVREVTTITLYPADANIAGGIVQGHKGNFLAENGIELEVWNYSDHKTDAIWASGDLPDIMYVAQDDLEFAIEAGMLLNLEPYLDKMPHVQNLELMGEALNYVRKYRSAGTGKIFCLPLSVGDNSTKVSISDSTERNAVKLRWDIYEEIGAPPIHDFNELIDVMELMVEAHPVAEDGTPFYGTVLNNGMDTSYWSGMILWYRWHGYNENQLSYLLETDMVKGTYSSILQENSLYYQGLQWYNEVFRRGLLDPDSINNDRPTQKTKVDNGYVMVPSGSLPGWAPKYYEYYIPDSNIYYSYSSKYGETGKVIAVNANTQNLEACLKLLDMWYNPDACFRLLNGPEGDLWYTQDGNAFLTEYNMNSLLAHKGDEQVRIFPSTGENATLWNISFGVNSGAETSYGDGKGNHRIIRTAQWYETMNITFASDTFDKWMKTTGYTHWKEWLSAENAYYSESVLEELDYFLSLPTEEIQQRMMAINEIVVNASWEMVYAKSEENFQDIWIKMREECLRMGAEELIQWRLSDIDNAKVIKKSLRE